MAIARILFIDDEEEFVQIVAERLRNRGVEVDSAHDGASGIALAEEHTYDAVLLDLAMPGMDGMETMRRLLEIDQALQVIILTGHGSVDAGVEAIKHGASDFIEKPADIDKLVDKLSDAQQRRLEMFEEDVSKKMSELMKKRGW